MLPWYYWNSTTFDSCVLAMILCVVHLKLIQNLILSVLIQMLYIQNYIIYLKIVSAFKVNSRPYVVLIHWVSFICLLCLKFSNELYENNIWHWDINEVGFKMMCTCCFHIVCTGLKQKSLLAHYYEWKNKRNIIPCYMYSLWILYFLW